MPANPTTVQARPSSTSSKAANWTNALVVVVRYFGGTKLGIPGLIEAYGSAAADALDAAPKAERILTKTVEITFEYAQTSEVGRVIQKFGLKPSHSEYGADCRQSLEIRLRDHAAVVEIFKEIGILNAE